MSFMYRIHLLVVSVILFAPPSSRRLYTANAQRGALCFSEENPISCDMETDIVMEDFTEPDWEKLESTCSGIFEEYTLPQKLNEFDLSIYQHFFSDLSANTELCRSLKRYFPYCEWCASVSCFTHETPPSCDSANIQGMDLDDYDLLEICSELEEHLLFHGAVQFQLDKHVGVLGDFVVDFTEKGCDRFRYVYSQCWWCAPNITSDNNYCSFDALCASSHVEEKEEEQQEVVNADEENPILSTCNELDWWVGEEGRNKVSTKGLCQRAVAAMQQRCPQYCDPCFDEVHPPSCSGEGIVVDNSTDVLETCFDMWKLLHGGYQGNNSFGNDPFHLAKHMDLLSPIRASSPRCDAMRQSYHLCYWCSKSLAQASSYHECAKDICVYEGEPEKFDSAEHEGVSRGEMDSACDDIRHTLAQDRFPTTADLCEKAERFHRYCSCDEPNPVIEYTDYLGADSDVNKNALVWVSRVSAFLSFLGGFYILWDVFRSKSSISVYHELMVGIACFDLSTAFAWAFATAAIPADDGYSISGAEGNDATCKAQGYFIQLGFTSVLYNVSLAMYYLLVIIRSWRERKLRKIRLFLHGPPLLVGFGLAFGGLPFYAGFDYVCHLAPDLERGDNLWKVFVFTVVPIGFSMFCITATMLFIYLHVRKKTLAARRWRLGSGDLDNRVFWQALFYTLSFYITWPVVFLVYLTGIDTLKDNYGLSVLMAFVSPLQGFNNFLVYVRPKAKFHPPCLRSVTGTMSSIFMRIDKSGGSLEAQAGMETKEGAVTTETNKRRKQIFDDPSVAIASEQDPELEINLERIGQEGHT